MGWRIEVDDVAVDGRDVAAWSGRVWTGTPDAQWRVLAEQYVTAHPRSGRPSEAQRLALLRRLAAGPATRTQLLAAMRRVGWVGASDLENRLRELRSSDSRGAGRAGLDIRSDGEVWSLAQPFADLDQADHRALGFAKAMVGRLEGPLATRAALALERLLPGVAATTASRHAGARYLASPADLEKFSAALDGRRPIRVRYFSLNRGVEGTYTVVPVEYVTVGATVKAICVLADAYGHVERELQLALDRLTSVEPLPDWKRPRPKDLRLRRSRIVLDVTDELYRVLRDRNVFDIGDDVEAEQSDEDNSWRVTGSFPVVLAWDVMEQLCAWAGSAQVREPYWLVNAVVRRLTAGLRVMAEGAAFDVVKPEPERPFASHGEAVAAEDPLPPPAGPRKLRPAR